VWRCTRGRAPASSSHRATWDQRFPDDDAAFARAVGALGPTTGRRVVDAVLAAGLITHFDDPLDGLRSLAVLCRPDARLARFHPVGRAALAARHGHDLRDADVRAPANLATACASTGWELLDFDDGDDVYLAVARRDA
jgi:hypothetical protein